MMESDTQQDQNFDVNSVKDHISGYVKNRLEYIRLSVIEWIAKGFPVILFVGILGFFLIMFWVMINIAVILGLWKLMGSLIYASLITSMINLVMAVVVIVFYKPLIHRPVSSILVKLLTNEDEDENK